MAVELRVTGNKVSLIYCINEVNFFSHSSVPFHFAMQSVGLMFEKWLLGSVSFVLELGQLKG